MHEGYVNSYIGANQFVYEPLAVGNSICCLALTLPVRAKWPAPFLHMISQFRLVVLYSCHFCL